MECPKSVKILDKQLLKCCQVMSKETYRMNDDDEGDEVRSCCRISCSWCHLQICVVACAENSREGGSAALQSQE
jgi:hypothetical protein